MYTHKALQDLHARAHKSFRKLLSHCGQLSDAELHREIPGFGYPSVQLQLHHAIGAEEYWIGVLKSNFKVEDNAHEYPTIAALEAYREQTFAATEEYLEHASADELNTVRAMMTWGDHKRNFMPAHVVLRTITHLFHHQGQVTAMCRLIGKPISAGLDFPLV